MMHRVHAVLVLVAAANLAGCAVRRVANDLRFDVTGVVTTEDNTPIEGAEITLQAIGPVYEGVDLVKTRQIKTNDTGGFVFAYITDERGGKYTITVRKDGFEPQTISGGAPPDGHHTIRLKKLDEPKHSIGGALR